MYVYTRLSILLLVLGIVYPLTLSNLIRETFHLNVSCIYILLWGNYVSFPFFFPFIIKHFNVYPAPTFPGTRIQWWELYFSLILQLSINLRTILNLKSDLTTFFLPSGSRASHHNPLACPVSWGASSAALKPSTGPASFVPLESQAGDKGTASYRKLEPPGRACFALQSSFLHFFSSSW